MILCISVVWVIFPFSSLLYLIWIFSPPSFFSWSSVYQFCLFFKNHFLILPIFCIYLKNDLVIYLELLTERESQRDFPLTDLLPTAATPRDGWAKASSLAQVSHRGIMNPNTWAVSRALDLKLGLKQAPMWDMYCMQQL